MPSLSTCCTSHSENKKACFVFIFPERGEGKNHRSEASAAAARDDDIVVSVDGGGKERGREVEREGGQKEAELPRRRGLGGSSSPVPSPSPPAHPGLLVEGDQNQGRREWEREQGGEGQHHLLMVEPVDRGGRGGGKEDGDRGGMKGAFDLSVLCTVVSDVNHLLKETYPADQRLVDTLLWDVDVRCIVVEKHLAVVYFYVGLVSFFCSFCCLLISCFVCFLFCSFPFLLVSFFARFLFVRFLFCWFPFRPFLFFCSFFVLFHSTTRSLPPPPPYTGRTSPVNCWHEMYW